MTEPLPVGRSSCTWKKKRIIRSTEVTDRFLDCLPFHRHVDLDCLPFMHFINAVKKMKKIYISLPFVFFISLSFTALMLLTKFAYHKKIYYNSNKEY